MAGRSTRFGDDRAKPAFFQPTPRHAGQYFLTHQNQWVITLGGGGLLITQMAQQTVKNIMHISQALLQYRILNPAKHQGKFLPGQLHRTLGTDRFFNYQRFHFGQQNRIFNQQRMGAKNGPAFFP